MTNNEVFTKYVLKQIAGTVVYDSANHTFQLSLRNPTDTILKAIYSEGEKWDMSHQAVDDFISKVINEIELSYQPIEQSVQYIDVAKDIKPGIQISLSGRDKTRGLAKLDLLYLGASKTNNHPRFLVLGSTRLGLMEDDIVEPAENTLLAIGYPLLFAVFRNGKRYPNTESIYRTFQIETIVAVKPSIIHEVIDARSEFTFLESTISQTYAVQEKSLSFGKNPMTLLLHNYSRKMPIYADFTDNGIGKFQSNTNIVFQPSNIRNILFGITKEEYKERPLLIETIENGEIYVDSENTIKLKKSARGRLVIK